MQENYFYFAYGSNLCQARLQTRIGDSPVLGTAALVRHRLAFHKNGQDGSAKCDAFYTDNSDDVLWGAVYSVTPTQKQSLDVFEGVNNGYEVKHAHIELQNEPTRIIFYAAQQDYIDTDLLPYDWYHAFVLHGARSHDLPPEYLDAISKIPYQLDMDRRRRAENQRILDIQVR